MSNTNKPFYKKWLFITFSIFFSFIILVGIFGEDPAQENTQISNNKSLTQKSSIKISLPKEQEEFISIVKIAQEEIKNAKNDMLKGGIKAEREKSLCSLLRQKGGKFVKNWVGVVSKIDANSEGKGVLEIKISHDVFLRTMNNSFSDLFKDTLISPDSDLFEEVSQMEKGQLVKFSGKFFEDPLENNCLYETSMSLDGKIKKPEFLMRFTSVKKIEGGES